MKILDSITKTAKNILEYIFLDNTLEYYKTKEDLTKNYNKIKQRTLRYIAKESGNIELSISALELIHEDVFLGQRAFRHILKHNECNPQLRKLAALKINKRGYLGRKALQLAIKEDEDYYVASACLNQLKNRYKFVAKTAKHNSEPILRKEAFDLIKESSKSDKWKQKTIGNIAIKTEHEDIQLRALKELKVLNDKNQKYFKILSEKGLSSEIRKEAIPNINFISIEGDSILTGLLNNEDENEEIKMTVLNQMSKACQVFCNTLRTRVRKDKNPKIRKKIIEMLYINNRKGFKTLVKVAKEDEDRENRQLALNRIIEESGKKAKIIDKIKKSVEEYWKKHYPEEETVSNDKPTPKERPVVEPKTPTKTDIHDSLINSGKPPHTNCSL